MLLKFSISLLLFLLLLLWFLLLSYFFKSSPLRSVPLCDDGSVRVHVYDLPSRFNLDLIRDCRHLDSTDGNMCPHVANRGLGQPLPHMGPNWFATNQFMTEMIFHARMENHPCRTSNPDQATLFYVPFCGGLQASTKFRESNLTERDHQVNDLVEYLNHQPTWQRHLSRDHFLALGRIAWNFMRNSDAGPDYGANCLLNLPHVKNMSVMTVERHPWGGEGTNQHGIPYVSYFHPMSSHEMLKWQEEMRRAHRSHLFSFVGALRSGIEKAVVRDEIVRQCAVSTRCKILKCGRGESKCHEPDEVIKVSQFCMQAPGDSFTRRSTFDSVLAGCIPVFFSPHTAYSQYVWYLPDEPREYSVYIAEEKDAKRIEEVLSKIPIERVERMRSRVIDLIPRITYVHPNATNIGFRDAVDVALAELSKHVQSAVRFP